MELMITIAILAILLMVAVPSFDNIRLNSRLNSYANDLAAGVTVARSEAIKRNAQTRLCASSNGVSCGGDWNEGWIVLAVTGNTMLRAFPALPSGYLISGNGAINFAATGVGADATVLTVCRASPLGSQERVITISVTGRASIEKTVVGSCT